MTIKFCHHQGFTVTDVDRSITFYRDVLGLELVRISDRSNIPCYDHLLGYDDVHLRVAILQHPATQFILELIQYINPPGKNRPQENAFVGASHLAFEIDDVDKLYQKIQEAGFSSINPPTDVIRDGKTVARAMYGLDPDGISVELFEEYEDVVKQ